MAEKELRNGRQEDSGLLCERPYWWGRRERAAFGRDDVRAMVRHPGATANLVQLGAEVVVADFDDSASLVEAHRGVEGQRPAGPDSSGCRPS